MGHDNGDATMTKDAGGGDPTLGRDEDTSRILEEEVPNTTSLFQPQHGRDTTLPHDDGHDNDTKTKVHTDTATTLKHARDERLASNLCNAASSLDDKFETIDNSNMTRFIANNGNNTDTTKQDAESWSLDWPCSKQDPPILSAISVVLTTKEIPTSKLPPTDPSQTAAPMVGEAPPPTARASEPNGTSNHTTRTNTHNPNHSNRRVSSGTTTTTRRHRSSSNAATRPGAVHYSFHGHAQGERREPISPYLFRRTNENDINDEKAAPSSLDRNHPTQHSAISQGPPIQIESEPRLSLPSTVRPEGHPQFENPNDDDDDDNEEEELPFHPHLISATLVVDEERPIRPPRMMRDDSSHLLLVEGRTIPPPRTRPPTPPSPSPSVQESHGHAEGPPQHQPAAWKKRRQRHESLPTVWSPLF